MSARIELPLRRRPLRTAEYRAMPESLAKHSVLGGILIEEPPPDDEHQRIVTNLLGALLAAARSRNLGTVRCSPYAVWLTEDQMVQPDILFVAKAREAIIHRDGIHGAPDLVVEILSPSTRHWDRAGKRDLYARRGALELWLIDPKLRQLEIHAFARSRHAPLRTLASMGTLETPLLPGFKLPVWRLFER